MSATRLLVSARDHGAGRISSDPVVVTSKNDGPVAFPANLVVRPANQNWGDLASVGVVGAQQIVAKAAHHQTAIDVVGEPVLTAAHHQADDDVGSDAIVATPDDHGVLVVPGCISLRAPPPMKADR